MIIDSQMHAGDFPMFDLSIDDAGRPAARPEAGIATASAFVRHDHRALCGPDTPFHHPSVELAMVRVSGRSTDLNDPVLGANSQALFLGDEPFAVVA